MAEDPNSPETKAWVQAQNRVTFDYLEEIPARDRIRRRLETLWNYERFGVPSRQGPHYVYSHNTGLQPQPVIYLQSRAIAGRHHQRRLQVESVTVCVAGATDRRVRCRPCR